MNLFRSSVKRGGTARVVDAVGVEGVGVAGFGSGRPSIVGSGPTAVCAVMRQR